MADIRRRRTSAAALALTLALSPRRLLQPMAGGAAGLAGRRWGWGEGFAGPLAAACPAPSPAAPRPAFRRGGWPPGTQLWARAHIGSRWARWAWGSGPAGSRGAQRTRAAAGHHPAAQTALPARGWPRMPRPLRPGSFAPGLWMRAKRRQNLSVPSTSALGSSPSPRSRSIPNAQVGDTGCVGAWQASKPPVRGHCVAWFGGPPSSRFTEQSGVFLVCIRSRPFSQWQIPGLGSVSLFLRSIHVGFT